MRAALFVLGLVACSSAPAEEHPTTEAQPITRCAERVGPYRAVYTPVVGDCGTPASVDVIFDEPISSADCKVGHFGYSADGCELTIEESCAMQPGSVRYTDVSVADADARGKMAGAYTVTVSGTEHDCTGTFRVEYTHIR